LKAEHVAFWGDGFKLTVKAMGRPGIEWREIGKWKIESKPKTHPQNRRVEHPTNEKAEIGRWKQGRN
jgi:hypothetical protein